MCHTSLCHRRSSACMHGTWPQVRVLTAQWLQAVTEEEAEDQGVESFRVYDNFSYSPTS